MSNSVHCEVCGVSEAEGFGGHCTSQGVGRFGASEHRFTARITVPSPDWAISLWRALHSLGHIPLKQGNAYECPRCGASGSTTNAGGTVVLTGAIATACAP